MTVSCYQADDDGRACGKCDSCRLRSAGFAEAGLPTRHAISEAGILGGRLPTSLPQAKFFKKVCFHQSNQYHAPRIGSLAQLVEQLAFNQLVVGSNPTRPTISLLEQEKPEATRSSGFLYPHFVALRLSRTFGHKRVFLYDLSRWLKRF